MNRQPMPGIVRIARNQFGLLVGTKYVAGLAGFIALSAMPPHVFGVFEEHLPPWEAVPRSAFLYITMIGSGAIAGVITWFSETPRNRRYHWGMPVRREVHDVVRIVTGAIWLLMIVAAACVASWIAEPDLMRDQWLRHAPLFYAGVFLISLLMYLLATIPTLLSTRPFVWIVGTVSVVFALASKPVERYTPALATIGDALFREDSRGSLGAAIAGGILTAPWLSGRERYRVFLATSETAFKEAGTDAGRQARYTTIMEQRRGQGTRMTPRTWFEALAIWYAVAILGIALALRRRPDV